MLDLVYVHENCLKEFQRKICNADHKQLFHKNYRVLHDNYYMCLYHYHSRSV